MAKLRAAVKRVFRNIYLFWKVLKVNFDKECVSHNCMEELRGCRWSVVATKYGCMLTRLILMNLLCAFKTIIKLILSLLSSMFNISQTYVPSNHLWKAKFLQIAPLPLPWKWGSQKSLQTSHRRPGGILTYYV